MRIRLDYREGITAMLTGLDRRLKDLSPFWRDYVAPYTYNVIERIFRTEGYNQWDELNPQYAARKNITHPGQPILRRDDVYYQAATGPDHSDSVTNIEPLSLILGVETAYAGFHEQGTDRLPQRAVYALIPALLDFDRDVAQLGEDYTRDVINNLERVVRL